MCKRWGGVNSIPAWGWVTNQCRLSGRQWKQPEGSFTTQVWTGDMMNHGVRLQFDVQIPWISVCRNQPSAAVKMVVPGAQSSLLSLLPRLSRTVSWMLPLYVLIERSVPYCPFLVFLISSGDITSILTTKHVHTLLIPAWETSFLMSDMLHVSFQFSFNVQASKHLYLAYHFFSDLKVHSQK